MILGSCDSRHDLCGDRPVSSRKNRGGGRQKKTIEKSCFPPIFSENDQNLTNLKNFSFTFFP